jgi:hypothetical protein
MTNSLNLIYAESPDQAPNYNRDTLDVRACSIHTVIVVKKGTQSGKPTVDFQMRTEDGSEFVAMLTGEIVKGIAQAVKLSEPTGISPVTEAMLEREFIGYYLSCYGETALSPDQLKEIRQAFFSGILTSMRFTGVVSVELIECIRVIMQTGGHF